jgi:hypothetical protein
MLTHEANCGRGSVSTAKAAALATPSLALSGFFTALFSHQRGAENLPIGLLLAERLRACSCVVRVESAPQYWLAGGRSGCVNAESLTAGRPQWAPMESS